MELTPKLSTDMFPFPRNPPSMLSLMNFFLKTPRNDLGSLGAYEFLSQNTKERSWQPRGVPGEEEGVRNEREGRVIYRENPLPTP
jgi:hypothetical protein